MSRLFPVVLVLASASLALLIRFSYLQLSACVRRQVVLATERDLGVAGFSGLTEGCYLVDGSGSNGVIPAMVGMSGILFGLLQFSAWTLRLPAVAAAREVAARADAGGKETASDSDNATSTAAPASLPPPPPYASSASGTPDVSLAEAQRSPHFYLLGLGTFTLCTAGLPFMAVGGMMVRGVWN